MSRNSNSSTTTAPLCLACSSSLPPRLWKRTTQQQQSAQSGQNASGNDSELLFLTRCCGRPICPSCLTSNPRLARYNPCLACLGGVGAVGTKKLQGQQHPTASNVDGAVRDEDVFVVGDEDEDGASETETDDGEAAKASGVASPPSEAAGPPEPDVQVRPYAEPDKPDEPTELTDSNQGSPGRYYIRPDDTLLGISLRLGVEVSTTTTSLPLPSGISQPCKQGRTLCKLNDLPPSALRTTPHLLHTRTFLVLPQPHSQQQQLSPEEEAQRTRVHAQVSLQRVTKETDGRIAQAYVALAEDSDSEPDLASLKAEGEKESRRVAPTRITLEERALDRYLDDEEWERRERAEGRGVHIQRFPIGGPQVSKSGEKVGRWGL
jgi:hypothetical protein